MMRRVRKAVLPVAGLGTRFLPATKAMPKEMLTVVDRPVIQHAVQEALDSGIEQLIFVTGRGKTAIEDHFDHAFELEATLRSRGKLDALQTVEATNFPPGTIAYVRQQEPLGLGHAVWCARHVIGDEPFAVMLPDDVILGGPPCLSQLLDVYKGLDHSDGASANLIGVEAIEPALSRKFGVLDVDQWDSEQRSFSAKGIVEKPEPEDAPSNMAVFGRYILDPSVLTYLDRQERGAGGEIQLTDAIDASIKQGVPTYGRLCEGRRFDCGSQQGFVLANVAYALQDAEISGRLKPAIRALLDDD
ncbi:MAG: UTP--glucose-1-phosphate uridylyltransferase [Rhodospirillaceae bacterium TMED140]|nr:UTP--glucose-1-phosphate uridylyltransferase [Rhodospirillaceae bacterium]OUX68587.1 MAG: UTP--glucose-1-phosphate uridylyltransferase [Rhodospirillaceae bacterium TMED140]